MENNNSVKKYIFISYSTKDVAVVEEVNKELSNNNIRFWLAKEEIKLGENYASEIERAIRSENCAGLLLFLSKESQASSFVINEVSTALQAKKPVIPLKIEDLVLSDSFDFFLQTSVIFSFKEESKTHFESLVSCLKGYTNRNTLNE